LFLCGIIETGGQKVENIPDFFSRLPFFEGLKQNELNDIAAIAVKKHYSRGENVFFEGDPGHGFYVVVRGSVKIYKESFDGKEVIIHICGPLDQFGQVAVYAGMTFPASAMAISDTEVILFPRLEFLELIKKNPSLALSMLSTLSLRIRQVTSQLESIALKEVPGRLAAYLMYVMYEQNDQEQIRLGISRVELAGFLGTTPETLSRILAKFEEEKLIKVEKREITILNLRDMEVLVSKGRF